MRRMDSIRGAALAVAIFFPALPLAAQARSTPAPARPIAAGPIAAGASLAAMRQESEPEFLHLRMTGRDVGRGVRKVLTELNWHRDFAAAASEATQRQRPILWLQMLGNLRGFT